MDQNMATRACCVSYLRAMRLTLSEVKVTDSRSFNRKGQAMECVRFSTVGLYAFPWWSVSVGTSCPLSCPCSLLTNHVYTWTHRYPWPSGGRGWQNSPWPTRATLIVTVLCLYYTLPQQHAEIPVDAPWKASIFYPQDGIQKLPHHCPLFIEWQRTLLCDLVSQGTIHLKSVCTQC